MLARITVRAELTHGFRFDSSEFDIRLPPQGEPEEIIGATIHATNALAVGSARIEPLDSIVSREDIFNHVRYTLRLEDRAGNCRIVHHDMTFDSTVTRSHRITERCQPLYMAEVVRRARRIARLPLRAGRLDDHWSAALAAIGMADVYMDSVVITTSSLVVRASFPIPPTIPVVVDSISAGLAAGTKSWSVVGKSAPISVATTLKQGEEWRRQVKRFVIPLDSAFDVKSSWPVFEVYLSVPKTTDNPLGIAWTYAHGRKGFFGSQ